MSLVGFLILVSTAQLPPESPDSLVAWSDDTWQITGDRNLRITQCGFNTCVALLELFERQYTPTLVSLELRPTTNGIRMGDLRRVLAAHGLNAIGRTDVTPEELIQAVRDHSAIIVALPGRESWQPGHYVFLIAKGDRVFSADPPFHFTEITADTLKKVAKKFTCLIVNSRPKRSAIETQSAAIRLEPQVISKQWESLEAAGVQHETVEVRIHNTSKDPVAIAGVQSGCGCATSSLDSAIVDGESYSTLPVQISVAAFASKGRTVELLVSFADGSQSVLRIVSEHASSSGPVDRQLSETADIFISPCETAASVTVAVKRPTFAYADGTEIVSNVSWCKAEHIDGEEVRCIFDLSDPRLRGFSTSPRQLLLTFMSNEHTAGRLQIRLFRKAPAAIVPRLQKVSASSRVEFEIVGTTDECDWQVEDVSITGTEVDTFNIVEGPEPGRWMVRGHVPDEPREYVCSATMVADNGAVARVSSVIQVVDPASE